MRGRMLFILTVCMISSGCEAFDRTLGTPIGYSTDENGRRCTTYETKSDRTYETICDYGGQYPASANNPLSKQ